MNEQLLKMNGLSVEILDTLSFESHLGIPLKNNLHYFDKDLLIAELVAMTEWLDEQEILSGIALDYRVIHVCYQKSGEKHYPIETGRIMREKYESGLIRNTACNNQQANCVWRVCTLPLCGYRAGVSDYRQRTSFMRK